MFKPHEQCCGAEIIYFRLSSGSTLSIISDPAPAPAPAPAVYCHYLKVKIVL